MIDTWFGTHHLNFAEDIGPAPLARKF